MRNKLFKRSLALLLVLCLALGTSPAVYADEGNLGSGTPDGTPPQLISIELSATSGAAPGSVAFTAEATDDVSGVQGVGIHFTNEYGDYVGGWAHASYKDPATGEYIPYPDGKFHGEINLGQYVSAGTYQFSSIYVSDNADNHIVYTDEDYPYPDQNTTYVPVPDWFTQREFTVTYSATPDHTPPELIDIQLSTTELTAPGTIDVIVDATDDVSGVFECKLFFTLQGGDYNQWLSATVVPTYYDKETKQHIPYPDGKLHGNIPVSDHAYAGTYVLDQIYISDGAGNDHDYSSYEGSNDDPIPDSIANREFTIHNDYVRDTTPPVLTELTFASHTVTVPGVIEFTATVDGNCEGMVFVYLWCEETQKELECWAESTYRDPETGKYVPYPDGKLHGTSEKLSQYIVGGTFVITHIDVYDDDGNWVFYVEDPSQYGNDNAYAFPEWLNREIRVLNSVADVTTNVAKPEFVDQIASAADDAYIKADFSGEATLPETAFDAISGTDKTLDLVSDGVTWRFNGNDIVNDSKPIDLNVNISELDESDPEVAEQIGENLNDAPAVVMKFAENGVLPGKATIQIKVDHAMREYLGASRELNVYYFNNQTGKLELIAENLMVVNDTYVEFPITHCSYYVLSAATVEEHTHAPEKVEFMDATHEADGYKAHYACSCGVLFADAEGTEVITEEEIRIARYELGDVDHDHRLTSMDAMLLMQHKAGLLTEKVFFCPECADVDGRMGINSMDAMLILQFRAGLIESFR